MEREVTAEQKKLSSFAEVMIWIFIRKCEWFYKTLNTICCFIVVSRKNGWNCNQIQCYVAHIDVPGEIGHKDEIKDVLHVTC